MSYRRKLELLRQIEDEASHESVPTWAEEPILAAVRELRRIIDQEGSAPEAAILVHLDIDFQDTPACGEVAPFGLTSDRTLVTCPACQAPRGWDRV